MSVIHVATYPSGDIEGVWIGHVLDIDVVTHGRTREEARAAAVEAFGLCRNWDRDDDHLPARQPAPAKDWTRPHEVVEVP